MCADETSCDWERVELCAFAAAGGNVEANLNFLDCMDSSALPLFYNDTVPRKCAEENKLDWNTIAQCFKGSEGDKLVKKAQAETLAHAGSSFYLPLVQVNNKTVCTSEKCNYSVIANAIRGGGVASDSAKDANNGDAPNITYFFASK